jgi:o-succinylbenzoate synthase
MNELIIKQINLQFCKLRLSEPLITANQTIRDRTGIIVQVFDQFNSFGLGESSPLIGFEMETIIHTARTLKRMQKVLIGEAISTIDDILDLLTTHNLPPAAKHGIELALLNLLASHQQKPLAKLLHSSHRPKVSVNALIGQVSPELAVIKTRQFCQEGYKCLKVKVGDSLDLARVQAVRTTADAFTHQINQTHKQTNQRIQIRIDANQAWTVSEAIQKLKVFAGLDIEYVEQPVNADNLNGMAEVQNSVKIAIAADESIKNMEGLEQVIKTKAASIVILKPMALGGILTAQKAAKVALEAGLDVVFTSTLDGAIARLGALHLAAMPEITRACGLAATELFATDDLLTRRTSMTAGELTI